MFRFSSIRYRIALAYIALLVVIMAALTLFLTRQIRQETLSTLCRELLTETSLLATSETLVDSRRSGNWQPGDPELETTVDAWSRLLDARVTLIDSDGTVLADSVQDPGQMENHAGRPEVMEAVSAGQGTHIRYSRTAGTRLLYTAVPIRPELSPANVGAVGVIRLSVPLTRLEQATAPLLRALLIAGALAILVTGLLSVVLAEHIARPLRSLTRLASRISRGDWEGRTAAGRRDEVGQLVRAFNRMAFRLQQQVTSLTRERQRLSTVLDNMVDGVLILEEDGRVRLLNRAAARILDLDPTQVEEHSFPQVARDHRLVDLWRRSQDRMAQQERVLDINPYVIRAVATPFWDGTHRAYTVVLQDFTRLRRLETVRRDFISNISHELRTPLASLRALVETLRDGALDDPPTADRFLDRIETEVDALSQMVQELLELSRIESGRMPLDLRPASVGSIVLRPVERLQPQAERAGIELIVDLSRRLPAVQADPDRIHTVMTNLVHNAIKFTPAGGSITIAAAALPLAALLERAGALLPDPSHEELADGRAQWTGLNLASPITSTTGNAGGKKSTRYQPPRDENGEYVVISVADTGAGIPRVDLSRIFERFYKADRARTAGGTGLGLAIAKHIVQAHGGYIWATSEEGRGSIFYFALPPALQ